MRAFSVIVRELRAEARHGFTYWLRVLGAGALMLAVMVASDMKTSGASANGVEVFQTLHATLFVLIWILVPLIVADCISREKRQGTLGLLFLTPLKPGDIVIAKALAHGLRSLTLCLAVIPVLTIPLLMGGVSWENLASSILVLSSSLLWALGAGLLASAWNERWARAMVVAAGLAGLFFLGFVCMVGFAANLTVARYAGYPAENVWEALSWGMAFCVKYSAVDFSAIFARRLFWMKTSIQSDLRVALSITFFLSILFLQICVYLSAKKIRHTWRDKSPSVFAAWLRDVFCKPKFLLPVYRKMMRRKIEKNPIGWLQRRTWSGRILVWGWLGLLIVLHSILVSFQDFRGLEEAHSYMGLGLLLLIAATAAGSFQRERETGLLELLLISPLQTGQILGGRLRGIWGQFWMVVILWLSIELVFFEGFEPKAVAFYLCCALTLPVVGLYYSLRRRHFLSSLAWTAGMGFFLPAYLAGIYKNLEHCDAWFLLPLSGFELNAVTFETQIIVAAWLGVLLYHNLSERRFVVDRRE